MKIIENENLAKYTTFNMGGKAKKLYIPENVEELLELQKGGKTQYLIGGGSNLLINDKKVFESVILLKEFDKTIRSIGEGRYYVGASVTLKELILKINSEGYGGIEYLISVPGLVGGAIYMNAGRGKEYNECIGKYIENVYILNNSKVSKMSLKDCQFEYRKSVFQSIKDVVIIGAEFKFEQVDELIAKEKRGARIKECLEKQDMSASNFGTVFLKCDKKIMLFVRKISKYSFGKISYSNKRSNWLLNKKNGTFKQAERKIKLVKVMHKILNKECEEEVKKWE